MDGLQFKLVGAKELVDGFASVSDGMKRRSLGRAVSKSAQVLVRPIRQATPKSTKHTKSRASALKYPHGAMRKSTGKKIRKYKGGALQAAYVGHRWPQGAAAHLVGHGTKDRTVRLKSKKPPVPLKKARFAGRVDPRFFMERAVEPNQKKVIDTMQGELAVGLDKERKKAAIKAAKLAGVKM